VPPSSGCAEAASSRLSTAPRPSCGVDPAPSPSGLGRGMRSSPSAASRPKQKQTPHLAVRDAVDDCRASAQAVPPPPSGSCFHTCWFLRLPLLRRCQAMVQKQFFLSGTGFLDALDQRRHPSLHSRGTCTVSGHRLRDWTSDLSSCRPMPELWGSSVETWLHPWLMSNQLVYSSTLVQTSYISCYVFSNQWWALKR
jgi:hypothetical protein